MHLGDSSELAVGIGLRIRDFRRAQHLTQAELARRIGIRNGPMNALEKGRHVPSGRVLVALARELGVGLDDIVNTPRGPGYVTTPPAGAATGLVKESGAAYAVAARRPTADLLPALGTDAPGAEGEALVDELARAVLALEDAAGAQKRAAIPLYLPFFPNESGIQSLVDRVRHLLGVGHAVLFDYLEMIENAGIRVIFCNLPEGCASLACYDHPNGNAFLFVRNGLNVERQLFRLLFELGRVYLHTLARLGPGRQAQSPGEGARLDELHAARKFAALFLMPENGVKSTVDQLGIAADGWTYELLLRIKHRFGVSAESFVIRLEEVKRIDTVLAGRFKEKIRAYYKKFDHGEPGGTRRVLSRNGRLGDLLLAASGRPGTAGELKEIRRILEKHGVGTE